MQKKNIIKLKNLSKHYQDYNNLIFNNVTIDFKSEIVAIVGQNGCGKTTLVKMLAGFESASKGKIFIRNSKAKFQAINDPSSMYYFSMAYAGQDEDFFENLTVKQNIVLGREITKLKIFPHWSEMEYQINELMTKFKIRININKYVRDLVIEDRKKLILLRALFKKPKILILDEPTVGLSEHQKLEFENIFTTFKKEGVAVIFASRDIKFAFLVADKVLEVKNQTLVAVLSLAKAKALRGTNWTKSFNLKKPNISNNTVPLLYLNKLTVQNPKLPHLENLEFALRPGEIYGIYDYDNCYGEVLVNSFLGLNSKNVKKRIWFNENDVSFFKTKNFSKLGIDWVPSNYYKEAIILDQDLINNYVLWHYHNNNYITKSRILKTATVQKKVREIIAEYEINAFDQGKLPISYLSKGEIQKFVLARSIEEKPKVLILANAFTDLDINSSKIIMQKLIELANKGSAILILSADPIILSALCNRVAVLNRTKFVCKLLGAKVTLSNISNENNWAKFIESKEIINKTAKMYKLPYSKTQIVKYKIIKFFRFCLTPIFILNGWLDKIVSKYQSRWG